jgi:hypothetical protein
VLHPPVEPVEYSSHFNDCYQYGSNNSSGQEGEAASGRFVDFNFAEIKFGGTAALENAHRPFWVDFCL